eukprot:4350689-Pleurochrysis_carterae.AAC.1
MVRPSFVVGVEAGQRKGKLGFDGSRLHHEKQSSHDVAKASAVGRRTMLVLCMFANDSLTTFLALSKHSERNHGTAPSDHLRPVMKIE